MPLTVLTDDQIRALLENLTPSELEGFRRALAAALHEYSVGTTPGGEPALHQPERISIHRPATGATTLDNPHHPPPPPPPQPTAATIRPTGAITLFTPAGVPLGILHASALTAFRTALASLCMIRLRFPAASSSTPSSPGTGVDVPGRKLAMLVYGCGEQAYWHVRLVLMAHGGKVGKVVFVGRGRRGVEGVVKRFVERVGGEVKMREGWEGCGVGGLVAGEDGAEITRVLEEEADVV
ncbi:hypothetical protein C8A05DRAFT_39856, partial [Staphylotrichum tortipilum]